ncbi:hypothetical protein [uncultured Gimesia sp.]|uniref:hypothetical protein n=1 Tax=uncultured Gimesia sp. TaxID=1678688 RepID=UPI0030DB350E
MENVIEDVACPSCYCVCDDNQVITDGQQITEVQSTCSQAQAWFDRSQQTDQLAPSIKGTTVSHAEAIQRAVELIQQAQSPLIYGMYQSATDSQRAAISLADQIGATIDTGAASGTRALQQVGEASCTLGEVRSRADLIIYWGADAFRSNECHRNSLNRGASASTRKIVSISAAETDSGENVDQSIQLAPGNELELIWCLRALLKDIDLGEKRSSVIAAADLQSLVSLIRQSQYIVFFFGPEFKQGPLAHRQIEALSLLVREIQAERRCHTLNVPGTGETKGADNVLAWQTGYAACVNFAAGYPRYSPCEYSANQLLEQSETDLCLLVGAQPLSGLSKLALDRLADTPLILTGPSALDRLNAEVYLPTGVYGIHYPGVVYRLDGTPMPLRGYASTVLPSEADVLSEISTRLKKQA